MEKHRPLIRTIYLYLFSLVGLAMVIVGAAQLVNLGLKEYVFQVEDVPYYIERPVPVVGDTKDNALSAEEEEEYRKKQEELNKKRTKEQKKKDLSWALSLILVGLPVWAYHWKVIQKDVKRLA